MTTATKEKNRVRARIGQLKDSIDLLQKAIEYMESPPMEQIQS